MTDKTGLLIIDHGSRRPEANRVVRQVAEMVRKESRFVIVQHAHMELAEPTIRQGFETCMAAGVDAIVVQPYFLGPGRHSTSDIPRMVREAARNHPRVTIRLGAPLGPHPKMGELILERIREAEVLSH
ncbi:MAG: sirohydrochlorin cobaltochelatase [Acidobacteria bacterium]|nr:sirohydrochlorin cobaltochelatase [Acidobacteriota bacterium]